MHCLPLTQIRVHISCAVYQGKREDPAQGKEERKGVWLDIMILGSISMCNHSTSLLIVKKFPQKGVGVGPGIPCLLSSRNGDMNLLRCQNGSYDH